MKYRDDIDGLRAVAVSSVLMFHAFPDAMPGGFVGVDIFFVISGYLITSIIAAEIAAGSFSIAEFYARRIRRLFPALLLVLVASLVVGWRILLPDELIEIGKEAAGGSAFVGNLVFWRERGYFQAADEAKPLLHLWSLGVEEQFYAVWPLLLIVAWRWKKMLPAAIAIAAASFMWNMAAYRNHAIDAFYLPMPRFWELMAGACLALWRPKHGGNWAATAGAALIGVATWRISREMSFPGWAAVVPVLGAALLIHAGPRGWANRILSAKPVVYLGKISYPLYLWHWPALVLSAVAFGNLGWPATVAVLAACVVLAVLTYELVEKPIRSRHAPMLPAALGTAMASAAVFGLTLAISDGIPQRLPAEARALLSVNAEQLVGTWRQHKCFLDSPEGPEKFSAECVDEGTGPLIVVWGDSYAAALYSGLRRLQARYGYRIAQFTASDCPPVLGVTTDSGHCEAVNRAVLERVKSLHPDLVLLNGNWLARWKYFRDGQAVAETLAKLDGLPVVLVGNAPFWPENLPRAMLRLELTGRSIPERMDENPISIVTDEKLRRIAATAGVRFVSLQDRLCSREGCLTSVSGQASAVDYGHLSPAAAQYAIEAFVGGATKDAKLLTRGR